MAKRKAEMAFMPSTPGRAQPSLETSPPITNKMRPAILISNFVTKFLL